MHWLFCEICAVNIMVDQCTFYGGADKEQLRDLILKTCNILDSCTDLFALQIYLEGYIICPDTMPYYTFTRNEINLDKVHSCW